MEYHTNTNADPLNGFALHTSGANKTDYATRPYMGVGKKSFLVLKHNKYKIIPTETIAFFYVKFESSFMLCFDHQEYSLSYSLEKIQRLVTDERFFRLNRQYLVNFDAVAEVERYFARKLLVTLTVTTPDELLVSKQKAGCFLHWLENR